MENWHILYETATGKSVSIGTLIADPIPDGLTSLALTDEEAHELYHGQLAWNEETRSLVPT